MTDLKLQTQWANNDHKPQAPFLMLLFSWSVVSDLLHPMDCSSQASLSSTISQSLLKLMCTELMMSFSHLILYRSLLLLPSIFPSIKAFSNELALHIGWPKYWHVSFSISPSNLPFGGIKTERGCGGFWCQLHSSGVESQDNSLPFGHTKVGLSCHYIECYK